MTCGEQEFWDLISEACVGAPAAIRESKLRGEGPFLYYKTGALKLAIDKPGLEWELASGEALRVATFEEIPSWIAQRARRLPILKSALDF